MTKVEIKKRIEWLDESMTTFENGYAEYLFSDFIKNKQDMHPGLILPVTAVLFADRNSELENYSKEFFRFMQDTMDEVSIKFKFDGSVYMNDVKLYKKVMIHFANTYIQFLTKDIANQQKFLTNIFLNPKTK